MKREVKCIGGRGVDGLRGGYALSTDCGGWFMVKRLLMRLYEVDLIRAKLA